MSSLARAEARRAILLVESDPKHQLLGSSSLFEEAGFCVTQASSFEDAKWIIETNPPDVLVTELQLGPYNGLHLILRSRVDHPHMAAIVVSPFADAALAEDAARHNATFLVRPFTPVDLLTAVNRALDAVPPERS